MLAIFMSSVTGLAYLLGLTYCIDVSHEYSVMHMWLLLPLSCQLCTVQDYGYVLSLHNETGGLLPVGQVTRMFVV